MNGRFEGALHAAFLDDGRLMRLLKPFAFHDRAGLAWPVPKGTVTDGASIPRFLWTVLGGPFEGRHRKAAVVHDYYCSVRLRPWQAVHRMFHEAMIAAEVSEGLARVMYLGVRMAGPGGPRWTASTPP